MAIVIREVPADQIEAVIPVLLLAEGSERALRWSLAHLADTVYSMEVDGELVGAVTMRWNSEPCEIMELAIAEERQGQGLGKQFVAWLLDEARRRRRKQMLVGTANSSIQNFAFYQKCGFRMDHIRHDYFRYYHELMYENGIEIRDMLVFSYDLAARPERRTAR
jgi:GNAT superfamily N-acetyltransferase